MKFVLTCLPIFNHVFTPPLPLAYLKAYVEHYTNTKVKVLDLECAYFYSSAIDKNVNLYWDKMWFRDYEFKKDEKPIFDGFVKTILAENPEVVGFSVGISNFWKTRYVAQEIKKINPDIYIIYGGRYFCRREPWRYLIALWHKDLGEVDCIVKNEGEETLSEILKTLESKSKPVFCEGATIRLKEKIVDGGNRNLIENIDAIPFPDFSDFSKADYLSDYIRMSFSRGCVGQCVYCVENDTMGTMRYRSPDKIVEEIKLRLSEGYKKFQLCDLAVNSKTQILLEVCRKIIEEKLDVEFIFSEFRHAPGLNKEAFELLFKAGFRMISFGTESGSQFILDKMSKGVKVMTIENNIKDAHNAGLKVTLNLMVGFPKETNETFMETIRLLRRNKDFIDGVLSVSPTEVCSSSKIHDKLDSYDLNNATLFQYPDIWESNDGYNFWQWRKALVERMHQYLREFQIPLVNFVRDGNPKISLFKSQIYNSKKTQAYQEVLLSDKDFDKLKLKLDYAAELKISEKCVDSASNEDVKFLLDVKNIGRKAWQFGGADWIRVGCKIYDLLKSEKLPLVELRQELPCNIEKGSEFQVVFRIVGQTLPAGKYRIKFDILNEGKFWFEDLGNLPLVEEIRL